MPRITPRMVYEIRPWFDNHECLYTDDPRLKDLAIQSPELQIASTYYRTLREAEPFAWDIVGERSLLASIAARRSKRATAR